jgi:hypothetical protein
LTVGDVQSEKVYISPWRSGSVLNFIIISLL